MIYQQNQNFLTSSIQRYISEFIFYIQLVKLGYTKFIEINVTNDYHGEVEKIL